MREAEAKKMLKDLKKKFPQLAKPILLDAKTLDRDGFVLKYKAQVPMVGMALGKMINKENGKTLLAQAWTSVRAGEL